MAAERLHKILANAGFGSRRKCEELIAAGEVSIDRKVVTEMGVKVDPNKQKIKCSGRFVHFGRRITLLFNKPRRVVTTTSDELGRRTVLDYLKDVEERVYPIGRLDWDSQGLILLTNNGELANLLTHPRYGVPRTYHILLKGELLRPP